MINEQNYVLDVGTMLHNLLFSYQKSVNNILGSSSETFVQPTLDLLLHMEEKEKLKLISGQNLEQALSNFADFLVRAGVAKSCLVNKNGTDKYLFKVEDCIWADHIHKELDPKDVVCPFGLIAMAIYRKFINQAVDETSSIYFPKGSETALQPLWAKKLNSTP